MDDPREEQGTSAHSLSGYCNALRIRQGAARHMSPWQTFL